MEIDVFVAHPKHHVKFTPEDFIDMFFRRLMNGWLSGEMSAEQARRWGLELAHWGRVELQDREVKAEGWHVVRQIVGDV